MEAWSSSHRLALGLSSSTTSAQLGLAHKPIQVQVYLSFLQIRIKNYRYFNSKLLCKLILSALINFKWQTGYSRRVLHTEGSSPNHFTALNTGHRCDICFCPRKTIIANQQASSKLIYYQWKINMYHVWCAYASRNDNGLGRAMSQARLAGPDTKFEIFKKICIKIMHPATLPIELMSCCAQIMIWIPQPIQGPFLIHRLCPMHGSQPSPLQSRNKWKCSSRQVKRTFLLVVVVSLRMKLQIQHNPL